MKFYFKENKEIQIFRNISTPPPYTTCYITVYAHVQCREPKKGQQNNQILKQTTGLCWSVLFINLCSCHTDSKSSVCTYPLSSIVSAASLSVLFYCTLYRTYLFKERTLTGQNAILLFRFHNYL